jgi:hypothetical protein
MEKTGVIMKKILLSFLLIIVFVQLGFGQVYIPVQLQYTKADSILHYFPSWVHIPIQPYQVDSNQVYRDSINSLHTRILTAVLQALDSMATARTELNLHKDTLNSHDTRISAAIQRGLDTAAVHRDTLVSHNVRIQAEIQRINDSLSVHRDTLVSHNTRIQNEIQRVNDSLGVHRDTLVSHNVRISAEEQRVNDSLAVHSDSLESHNTRINLARQEARDTSANIRSTLNAKGDSIYYYPKLMVDAMLNYYIEWNDTSTTIANKIFVANTYATLAGLNIKADTTYSETKAMIAALNTYNYKKSDSSDAVVGFFSRPYMLSWMSYKYDNADTNSSTKGFYPRNLMDAMLLHYYARGDTNDGTKGFFSRDLMTAWMGGKADTSYGDSKAMTTAKLAYKKNIADSLGVNDYARNWKLGEKLDKTDTSLYVPYTFLNALKAYYQLSIPNLADTSKYLEMGDTTSNIVSKNYGDNQYQPKGTYGEGSGIGDTITYDADFGGVWGGAILYKNQNGTLKKIELRIADGGDITPGVQAALALTTSNVERPEVYIPPGSYYASAGWEVPSYAILKFSEGATVELAAGINDTIFKLNGTMHANISGGDFYEAATAQHLWVGLGAYSHDGSVPVEYNVIKNIIFRGAKIAVNLMADNVGSAGWVNANYFENIKAFSTASFFRTRATSGAFTSFNTMMGLFVQQDAHTVIGLDSICGWGNSFYDTDIMDFSGTNISAVITSSAGNTTIYGGQVMYCNAVNKGINTTYPEMIQSRDIFIDTSSVTTSDTVFFFRTVRPITVDSICAVGSGTACNVTIDYRYGLTRNGAGTAIITTPAATTSITTGTIATTINSADIPADNYIRFRFSDVTIKSPLSITMYYHYGKIP